MTTISTPATVDPELERGQIEIGYYIRSTRPQLDRHVVPNQNGFIRRNKSDALSASPIIRTEPTSTSHRQNLNPIQITAQPCPP